jgi:hypothetical protein
VEDAARAIAAARAKLEDAALRIRDPKRRASFLERVDDHRRTMAFDAASRAHEGFRGSLP